MKILAVGTSISRRSINAALATYVAGLAHDARVESLHPGALDLPLFSEEKEEETGLPPQAMAFYRKIAWADALVLSFAEHNGSYTAAYKNLFDWTSRIDKAVFQNKPALFLSASPGPGGAASVLKSATESAPFFGARLVASISVPLFHENFDLDSGQIKNTELHRRLQDAVARLRQCVLAGMERQSLAAGQ